MDELTEVRAVRADAPTPDRARLAEGRRRLLAEADAAPRRTARRWRYPTGRGWPLLAAVASVTAVVVLAGQLLVDRAGDADRSAAAPTVEELLELGDAPGLLRYAAELVGDEAAPRPRPDQWVYSRTVELNVPAGTTETTEQESWTRYADPRAEGDPEREQHSPRGRGDRIDRLPDSPGALLAELAKDRSDTSAEARTEAEHQFETLWILLSVELMPPGGRAKLYRALAEVAELRVGPQPVTDLTGRPVLALYVEPGMSAADRSSRLEILLDPETLAYRGHRTVLLADRPALGPGLKRGEVSSASVVEETALVDRRNQRP